MPEKRVPIQFRGRQPVADQLEAEMDRVGAGYGVKQLVAEAALLAFFDLPPEVRDHWIERTQSASLKGGTGQIVREIRAKYPRAVRGSDLNPKEPKK